MPPNEPRLFLRVPQGVTVVVRLTLRSRLTCASLARPSVDDWVDAEGEVYPSGWRVDPPYVYLLQGGEARLTLTCPLPPRVAAGTVLTCGMRLPGTDAGRVPFEVEVVPAVEGPRGVAEALLNVDLPLGGEVGAADLPWSNAEATYALVAGLAGFDLLPARWLVAELLTAMVLLGEERAGTPEGQAFLDRIGRTSFFKNGVLAFTASRLPAWVGDGLKASSGLHAALGGRPEQGQILYIWERWLLGLGGGDLEAGTLRQAVQQAPLDFAGRVQTLGGAPERWFGSLVLGLAAVSPRALAAFSAFAEQVPAAPADPPTGPPPPDVLSEPGPATR